MNKTSVLLLVLLIISYSLAQIVNTEYATFFDEEEEQGEDIETLGWCPKGNVGDGCSIFCKCGRGKSCHPFIQKCFHYPRRINEPCVAGHPCAHGLTCEAGTHICRGPSRVNEPCHATRPCAKGLSCEAGSQRCRAPSGLGMTCHATRPCQSHLVCDSNFKCQKPGEVGEQCFTKRCHPELSCRPAPFARSGWEKTCQDVFSKFEIINKSSKNIFIRYTNMMQIHGLYFFENADFIPKGGNRRLFKQVNCFRDGPNGVPRDTSCENEPMNIFIKTKNDKDVGKGLLALYNALIEKAIALTLKKAGVSSETELAWKIGNKFFSAVLNMVPTVNDARVVSLPAKISKDVWPVLIVMDDKVIITNNISL